MTVTNQVDKTTTTGNGVATTFSFSPMVIFASTELIVVTTVIATGVETTRTEGTGATNWSLSITDFPATGSIVFPADLATPLPTTETITIKRVLKLEQQTDLETQGGYDPEVQEQQHDKGIMINIQQQEDIDRSIRVALTDASGISSTLPSPTGAGGKVIAVNAGVTAFEYVTPNSDTFISLPASSTDNAIVRFDGTGGASFQDSGVLIDDNGNLIFEGATADDFETTLAVADPTADRTVTLPNATDTLVGKATTDTLTNKTFDANGTGNSLSNVDVADLANGTDGELITWDAAAAPATVAAGSSGQVLTSNGAGAAPTFQAAAGKIVQIVSTQTGAVATGTTTIPRDDTIPQNTEGTEFMTLAITPTNTSNKLQIDVIGTFSNSASLDLIGALFQDSTANALAACMSEVLTTQTQILSFTHRMTADTTSETTFKLRVGGNAAGTTTFNGFSSGRSFGGVMASSITIKEISV